MPYVAPRGIAGKDVPAPYHPLPTRKSSATMSCVARLTAGPRTSSPSSRRNSGSQGSCLTNWVRQTRIKDGNQLAGCRLGELSKVARASVRNLRLEQRNEVLCQDVAHLTDASGRIIVG